MAGIENDSATDGLIPFDSMLALCSNNKHEQIRIIRIIATLARSNRLYVLK